MNHANALPYYPRFVFVCSDGESFSTADLDVFGSINETDSNLSITSFVPGRTIVISWPDGQKAKSYIVGNIEIHNIKYDLDKVIKGENENDCRVITGKKKDWLMEIYIFLNAVN